MSAGTGEFTARKRRSYLWGGTALLLLGASLAVLNLRLSVPEYQKVSWLLVGFFSVAGAGGVAVARGLLPQRGKVTEYGEALVVAILLAVAIRGGVVQAFKIPSGSMLPTLLVGDHLLVSKFLYGFRIPYTGVRLPGIRDPRRGDIVVFAYPQDDSKDFIKRVIGEPGDVFELRDKRVFVNGEPLDDSWGIVERVNGRFYLDGRPVEDPWGVFAGDPPDPSRGKSGANLPSVKIPPGKFFVMGDNRDRSLDSRFWGFVEEARIRGKAFIIYWSWESKRTRPRFGRMGQIIH